MVELTESETRLCRDYSWRCSAAHDPNQIQASDSGSQTRNDLATRNHHYFGWLLTIGPSGPDSERLQWNAHA